ncbi:SMI1/KNR4 family protein [Pseudomonas schmalbachii]
MKLEWFDPTDDPIDPCQIDGAESLLGVRFPASYRSVLVIHHNSYGDADIGNPDSTRGACIGHWLSLKPWDSESIWSSLATWSEHQLPHSIIPFGSDGGGNYICFDYRSNSEPTVVFWYHELSGTDGVVPIAQTFDDFVRLLRSPPET